ncbi:MAG TPA: condensation domain-containing protein, partial [Gemmatimonadaceae bacterium]
MTSSSAPMSGDLASRLAQLTPAQRELLERKLREAGVDSPIGAATAATASVQGTSRVAPRTTSAPAPLTAAQELLWTLDQAMPGLPAYNVPRLLRIEGPLDVAALQRALDGLVLRHEALRTRFVATLEGPRQLADAGTAVPLDTVDVRALPDAGRTMASDRAIAAAARVAFDLAHDVLLRATLVREADERWRLLLLTHHIVSDEASRGIMLRELSTLYAAALEGRAATLPPLPIQFADYA